MASRPSAVSVRRRRPHPRTPSAFALSRRGAAALVAACLSTPACAQQWNAEASIGSQLTWTSNTALGSMTGEDDVVLTVRPRFAIRREGARLRVVGSFELNALSYINGTQPSRLLPVGDLSARLEAIERFFYVEGEARALQTSANPFGARSEDASSANRNTVTTTLTRFSPYIQAAAGPDMRYGVRSDNVKTSENGSTFGLAPSSATGYFGRHTASIEHDPRPLGWRLEAERSETRYDDSTQPPLVLDLARASVDYSFGPELTVGLRGGYERNSFLTGESRHTIYGAQMRWRPTERTLLSAFQEKRFFGSSWRLGFEHRMPRLAWNIVFLRGIETAPQLLFELPVTGNVAALLDAMFTTRYPDAAERARVVQEFMASRGLPAGTFRPTNIYSQRLSLVSTRSASVAFTGPRSTVALSAYHWRTEDALRNTPLTVDASLNNNIQYGAGVVFSHRLTPATSVNLAFDYSRIRALAALGADSTQQAQAQLRFTAQAAARTSAFFGAHYRKLGSNVATGGDESAVFAGLDHAF